MAETRHAIFPVAGPREGRRRDRPYEEAQGFQKEVNGDNSPINVIDTPRVPGTGGTDPASHDACHVIQVALGIIEFFRVGNNELVTSNHQDLVALGKALCALIVDVLRVVPADSMKHTPVLIPDGTVFGPAVAAALEPALKRLEGKPAMSSTARAKAVRCAKSVAMALYTRYNTPPNVPPELMRRWHPLLVALLTTIEHPTLTFLRPLWSEDRRTLLPPVDFVSATPPQPKCYSCQARELQYMRNAHALDQHDEGYGGSDFDAQPFGIAVDDGSTVSQENAGVRQEEGLQRDGVVSMHPCTLCPCLDALPDALYDAFEELGVYTSVRSAHLLDDPNTGDGRLAAQKSAMPGVTAEDELKTVAGISDVKLIIHGKATRDVIEHLTNNFTCSVGAASESERDAWDRDKVLTLVPKLLHTDRFRDALLVNCNPQRVAQEIAGERWVRDDLCAVGIAPYHRTDLAVEDHKRMSDAHNDAMDSIAALHKLFPAAAPLYDPRNNGLGSRSLWVPAWFHLQPLYGLATSPLPASIKTNVFPLDGALPRHLVCGRSGITLHEWLRVAAPPVAKIAMQAEKIADSARRAAVATGRTTVEEGKQRMLSIEPTIEVHAADWTFLRVIIAVLSGLHAMHSGVETDRARAPGAAPGVAHCRISPLSVMLDPTVSNASSQRLDAPTQLCVPVACLAQLTHCRMLPREAGEVAKVRGDRLDPAPQHRLFDLNQVLATTMESADHVFQHERAQKRQHPQQWLIAHDLWAVAMLILQFLALRTGLKSPDEFGSLAKTSGDNARKQVAELLRELADRCLPVKCWRQLYLVAEQLCSEIPKVTKEKLTTPTRDNRHPFQVLNLSFYSITASISAVRQLVAALKVPQPTTELDGPAAVIASPAHSEQAFHQLVNNYVKRGVQWRFSIAENRTRFIDGHYGDSAAKMAAWLGLPKLFCTKTASTALPTNIVGHSAPLHFRAAASGATLVITAQRPFAADLFMSVTLLPAASAARSQYLLQDLSSLSAKTTSTPEPDATDDVYAVAIPHVVCPVAGLDVNVDMHGPEVDLVALCTFGPKPTVRVSDLLAARNGRPLGVGFAFHCVSRLVSVVEHLHTAGKTAVRGIGLQSVDIVASRALIEQWLTSPDENIKISTEPHGEVTARLAHIAFAANTVAPCDRDKMRDSWDCEYPAAADTNPASSLDDDCYLHDWRSVVGVYLALAFGTDEHCAVRTFNWFDIIDGSAKRTREVDRASTILKVLAGRPPPTRLAHVLQCERKSNEDRQHDAYPVLESTLSKKMPANAASSAQLHRNWSELVSTKAAHAQRPPASTVDTLHALGRAIAKDKRLDPKPKAKPPGPMNTRAERAKRVMKPYESSVSSDSDSDFGATPGEHWTTTTVETLLDVLMTNMHLTSSRRNNTIAVRQVDRQVRAYANTARGGACAERFASRTAAANEHLQEHHQQQEEAEEADVVASRIATRLVEEQTSCGGLKNQRAWLVSFEHSGKLLQAVTNAVSTVLSASSQISKTCPLHAEVKAAINAQLYHCHGFVRLNCDTVAAGDLLEDLVLEKLSDMTAGTRMK